MKELHKWFDQAANYCASKKFEEAKRILNSITSVYPDFSEGYRLLGQIQYEEGNIKAAEHTLITALVKDPKNMWALIMMGNIFGKRKNDIDTARTYFNKVLEFYPKNPIAINNLAATMIECGEREEAIELFKKVIVLDNTYPNAYYGLALAYLELERNQESFDVALEGVKKGVDRPENKSVRQELIKVLLVVAKKLYESTNYWNVILSIKEELEERSNTPIELVYDDKLEVYAKLEYSKHHRRDKNIVRYNGSMDNYEHLIIHELGHLRLLLENDKQNVSKVVYSTHDNDNKFNFQYGAFLRRKLPNMPNEELVDLIKKVHIGINLQLMNCPLDLFVERYIYETYPIMRPLQLLILFKQEQDNIAGVKKGANATYFPQKIVKCNKVMNICTSLHFQQLYGINLINEYHPTKNELDQANDLLEEFGAYWNDENLKAGEEYNLIEYFLDSFDMNDIITISDEKTFFDSANKETPVSVDGGDYDLYTEEEKERQKNFEQSSAKPDATRDFMMTMYIFAALEYFKDKDVHFVRKVAQEIAMLGMSGIVPSQQSGYSVPSLPNKDMGGYQVLAYYYSSWKLAIPEMAEQLGLPYKNQYNDAQKLYKQKYGEELKY